jgi:hypothetical protein
MGEVETRGVEGAGEMHRQFVIVGPHTRVALYCDLSHAAGGVLPSFVPSHLCG